MTSWALDDRRKANGGERDEHDAAPAEQHQAFVPSGEQFTGDQCGGLHSHLHTVWSLRRGQVLSCRAETKASAEGESAQYEPY